MSFRYPLILLSIVALAVPIRAAAAGLPSLPLPACVEPTLPVSDTTICEGARVTLAPLHPEGLVGPAASGVSLAISTRTADFRLDADRGGTPQLITFTLTIPPITIDDAPGGKKIHSLLRPRWAEYVSFSTFFAGGLKCLKENDPEDFDNSCDGAQVPGSTPNDRAVLHREGSCPDGTLSCTYRVTWIGYGSADRVRQAIVYRVGIYYDLATITELSGGGFDPQCGDDLATTFCVSGGGAAYTAFRTDPPPKLQVTAEARRKGVRKFEFAANATGTDVQSYLWNLAQIATTSSSPVFEQDFADFDLGFSQGGQATITVTDRWLRQEFRVVNYSFLAPAGELGPLEIVSFDVVGVDDEGVATLKAVVKNTGSEALTNVFLFGDEPIRGLRVKTTPAGTALQPNESAEFTVTFEFDDRNSITPEVQAFGSTDDGTIKSAIAKRKVQRTSGPPPASTAVSSPSAAGDTILQVTSNNGFAAGDYVAVNTGQPNADVRRIEALGSLIFSAPMAHPHAVGEPVVKVSPPSGDTTPPTIAVTSPPANGAVCQGSAATVSFTCGDAGVGVEECGGAVTSGQVLDTSALGPREIVIEAWDENGNVAGTSVGYDVVFCSTNVDAFRCYKAKPSKGSPKFAPIPDVRVKHDFEDVLVDLTKPQLLCPPADTIGDGLLHPDTHLESYAFKAQKGQPKPVPQNGLAFQTQLGAFVVDVKKATGIALPTAESPIAPPQVVPTDVDRYACYPAKLAKGQPKLAKTLELTLTDGFSGAPKRVTVKKLTRLCVPTGVDGGAAKHAEHLLCFSATATKGRCAAGAPLNAGGGCKKEIDCGGAKTTAFCEPQPKFTTLAGRRVANELDAGSLDATKEEALCLPALPTP
jgi:hypothetical protein